MTTFQDKAKHLDLSRLTQPEREAVQREAALKQKANQPLTDAELADHLATQQIAQSLDSTTLTELGLRKDSPEYKAYIEDRKKTILDTGIQDYLDGKTQDERVRAAQELKKPRRDALRQARTTDLQKALAQIQTGEQFTESSYEVRRALLDQVCYGGRGFTDVPGVQHDNRTWQAALALLMGSDGSDPGKTDRGRVFHQMAQRKIVGNDNRDNLHSPANELLEIIAQVVPDIADLPQTGTPEDKLDLRWFINNKVGLKRQ